MQFVFIVDCAFLSHRNILVLKLMSTNPSQVSGTNEKVKRINPWIGIWRRPRETLIYAWQHLLESYIHRIYMLAGLLFMLAARLPEWYTIAPHPIGVMVQILMFAPMGGIFAGYLFAGVLKMVGKWMGKVVPSEHTRCMVAWSDLPFIAAAAVFLLGFLFLNRVQAPIYQQQIWLFQDLIGWLPLLFALPLYAWGIVTRIRSISVLLGLSTGKALLAWSITTFLAYVPVTGMLAVYLIMYYVTTSGGGGG